MAPIVIGPDVPRFILKSFAWQVAHLSTFARCFAWLKVTCPGLLADFERGKSGGAVPCPDPGAATRRTAPTPRHTVRARIVTSRITPPAGWTKLHRPLGPSMTRTTD